MRIKYEYCQYFDKFVKPYICKTFIFKSLVIENVMKNVFTTGKCQQICRLNLFSTQKKKLNIKTSMVDLMSVFCCK